VDKLNYKYILDHPKTINYKGKLIPITSYTYDIGFKRKILDIVNSVNNYNYNFVYYIKYDFRINNKQNKIYYISG